MSYYGRSSRYGYRRMRARFGKYYYPRNRPIMRMPIKRILDHRRVIEEVKKENKLKKDHKNASELKEEPVVENKAPESGIIS